MFQAFLNIFKIRDLRNKLFFTLLMLVIYRIGFWIPLPAVSQAEWKSIFKDQSQSMTDLVSFVSMFTGGALQQSSLFGLGILPYISAAIIMQLMATVYEPLKLLQKEGPAGRQKIQEYTRYLTVGLCLFQSVIYLKYFHSQPNVVYGVYQDSLTYWICGIMGMTGGTVFLMWLAEQVDKYGIGNGASLIITAGIVSDIPKAIGWISANYSLTVSTGGAKITPDKVAFLIAAFVLVTAGTVLITQGQRRIPVQQAKHTRGRRVYGGQRHYLPLRVNHGGVMPIIFASSLMMIPAMLFPWLNRAWPNGFTDFLQRELAMTGGYRYLYLLGYVILIYFFAYFWTSVQFQPKEMADQLRDNGSFIPGLRPGPRTADYLEKVMERITYVGAGFLAVIAVVPTLISGAFNIPYSVSSFLGGTGLLITVSVALDFVQRIEANLLMRNYRGFLGSESGSGRGPRLRSPRR